MLIKKISFCLALGTFSLGLFAYNPPPAGENLYALTSPFMLSGENSTAGGAIFHVHPGHISINPALPAAEQRIVIDAAYTALIGPKQNMAYGQAATIGTIIPSRFGVFTGAVQGVFVPFIDMQLQNMVGLRFAYSKDITDKLYVGIGLAGGFGSDWALGADLGVVYVFDRVKWLPFMKDIRIGASITGMGKPYNPKSLGINGTAEKPTGFPSFFTPHFGFAGTLFSVKKVAGGISLDISAPAFQNFVFDTSLQFLFADIVRISTAWQFNLRETMEGRASWYPSVSLSVKFGFSSKKETAEKKIAYQQNEMIIAGAYRYFTPNIHAASAGLAVYFGLKDTTAPEITLWGNNE